MNKRIYSQPFQGFPRKTQAFPKKFQTFPRKFQIFSLVVSNEINGLATSRADFGLFASSPSICPRSSRKRAGRKCAVQVGMSDGALATTVRTVTRPLTPALSP